MTTPADKKTPGKRKVGDGTPGPGRPKGMQNKTTVAIKEAILSVYDKLQAESGSEHGHFFDWAKDNSTEFYKIAAKLIPLKLEGAGDDGAPIVIQLVRQPEQPDAG